MLTLVFCILRLFSIIFLGLAVMMQEACALVSHTFGVEGKSVINVCEALTHRIRGNLSDPTLVKLG